MNRRPREIRAFLVRRGIKIVELAAEIGIHYSLVVHTIRGARNNRRVLSALRDLGCPAEYLALPDDLRRPGKAA